MPESGVNDVLFLHIAAVDDNGTIYPDFSEKVKLSIDGDIEILNIKELKAEAGIATALIKIGSSNDLINISVSHKKLTENLVFKAN